MTKKRITITIDKNLLKWLDARVKEKRFANRTHGLDFLVSEWKKQEYERTNNYYFRQ